MKIAHDTAARCFRIALPEGEATLDYTLDEARAVVTFTHTFVPETLRGRGLAEALVRAGLDWARDRRLRLATTCVYVQRHLQRHGAEK